MGIDRERWNRKIRRSGSMRLDAARWLALANLPDLPIFL